MIRLATLFLKREDGATAIEYGLIGALVSIVIIGAMSIVSGELGTMFTTVSNALGG